ncbi:alpha-xenorhabdolysin family binary toxin subunit B [Pseudomonas sp. 21LCFQ02]|uniref:alpha-xenorhabdolysin family binary toxin subunit B n=1 Tax=Pseudomonas sp. 21LCFQ02 TaxID=2957505 RepID=UPI00209B7507|nr:alpha-xenorhabdolysin family binary toxin subunit B [Pseudomonas sp. 21LCFQ02]MCO8166495.1 alpha-xenorhabdolysin family binary toxin subunit B [Pseudomonas sp. 21LCFQ02]
MLAPVSHDFKTPDLKVMTDAQTLIYNQIKSLSLDFLPVMKEKLPFVKTALSQASYTFRKELNKVLATARTINLNQTDQLRVQIESDTSLHAEQKQEALQQVEAQRTHILLTLAHSVHQADNAMLQSIDDLSQINLKPASERLQQTLQSQLDTHQESITELGKQIAALMEDKQILDAAITEYEKYNLADVFKNLLPSPEELAALTSTPVAKVAIISAGIARLEKLRGEISKGLNYLDLTTERDRLRAHYDQLLRESTRINQLAQEVSHDLLQLSALSELDQGKTIWVNEARKAVDSLRMFSETYLSDTRASSLIQQQLQELISYLNKLISIQREL